MYAILKNIIFRNVILVILSCCIFERTGISVISQIISCVHDGRTDFLLSDIEEETKETETNKEGSFRESWVGLSDFNVPEPLIQVNLLTRVIHDSKYFGSFYPSVPTPPPDFTV